MALRHDTGTAWTGDVRAWRNHVTGSSGETRGYNRPSHDSHGHGKSRGGSGASRVTRQQERDSQEGRADARRNESWRQGTR